MRPVDPETLKKAFYISQILLGVIFVYAFYKITGGKKSSSQFKEIKESSPYKEPQIRAKNRIEGPKNTPHTKTTKEADIRLKLTGIVTTGAPHEILGLSPQANEAQINAAYRNLIKQYHPDKVAQAGSKQWQEAQSIAHALTQARAEMLSKIKKS